MSQDVPPHEASYDVVVIGGGPAGHRAAVQTAKAGRSVLLIEQEEVGGECVRRGTIPSKTLRETALALSTFTQKSGGVVPLDIPAHLSLESLMARKTEVTRAHERFMREQLSRNAVQALRGRARFETPHSLVVERPGKPATCVTGEVIIIATGSRPRAPEHIAIDHEHILDSDSILSLVCLPSSLIVLGAGVIACEYASIFAALGVAVTVVDRAAQPLGFLDPEIGVAFRDALAARGVGLHMGRTPTSVSTDGIASVTVSLDDGSTLRAEKVLCALGRVAQVHGLLIERAGLTLDARGHIPVDANGRSCVSHIYAAGDVVGPPALASTAMDQGRRAARHALGLPSPTRADFIPTGIYTIPEIASVGLTEPEAQRRFADVVVGYARFDELARGHIAATREGLLKLVASSDGTLLGVHVIGEGAAELVHVGQMALIAGLHINTFIDHSFNFPTLTEAYLVAALQARAKLSARRGKAA